MQIILGIFALILFAMKNERFLQYKTYPFLLKYYQVRLGGIPYVEANDIIAGELLQLNLEEIELQLSGRLSKETPVVFQPLFTRLFTAQLCSYVDAQVALGVSIASAIDNYLCYCNLEDYDIFEMCLKLFKRYRYPHLAQNSRRNGRIAKRAKS